MISVKRYPNPVLIPADINEWEEHATFNPTLVKKDGVYHMLYRAISKTKSWQSEYMRVSSIGYANSNDGLEFAKRRQFITPEYDWERFGVEDPRTTFIDGKFVTFYTAVSTNPPQPQGIRIGVAISSDFSKTQEKHLVTPFNAKAMTLFPEKINGKYTGVLTVDTDKPPAKIAIVQFESLSDIWEKSFWQSWYGNVSRYTLALQRRSQDQVEVGLNPIKTEKGWLMVYSYIQNYYTQNKIFGIEAVLLALENPLLVVGKTLGPFMTPSTYYEKHGTISNIVFPSGGVVDGDNLSIYYGASDTTVCQAVVSISEIIDQMEKEEEQIPLESVHSALHLVRFDGNPILEPIPDHAWEEKAVFNTGVLKNNDKIYLFYRGMDKHNFSSIGLAVTSDGYHITERLDEPIYVSRAFFEKNDKGAGGCEDPRITQIDDTIYMFYVAYDGKIPKVALTSISESNFLKRKWEWRAPILISNPNVMDKNSALFPEKVKGKYAILHRLDVRIWIDFERDLSEFSGQKYLSGKAIAEPREGMWDSEKIGTGGPPLKTDIGWLLIYHSLSSGDKKYRLGIMVLDGNDPTKVILRLNEPILEPKLHYEQSGVRPGTVFSCGSAVLNDDLFVYYGAGDTTVGVAKIRFTKLIDELKSHIKK